jgi:hypothetical protein
MDGCNACRPCLESRHYFEGAVSYFLKEFHLTRSLMTHLADPSISHPVCCCCSDDEEAQTVPSDDIEPFKDSYFQKYCSSRQGTCHLLAIHKSSSEPASLFHYYYSSYVKKDDHQLK